MGLDLDGMIWLADEWRKSKRRQAIGAFVISPGSEDTVSKRSRVVQLEG